MEITMKWQRLSEYLNDCKRSRDQAAGRGHACWDGFRAACTLKIWLKKKMAQQMTSTEQKLNSLDTGQGLFVNFREEGGQARRRILWYKVQ